MEPLFHWAQQHEQWTPAEALDHLVRDTAGSGANAATLAMLHSGAMPNPVAGGMGLNGPNSTQFASPAMANLGLPAQGSPRVTGPAHTPSPAHMHMAGPVAMVHQHSQQGSNLSGSQGASANTSPNVTNKRRRPSGIKTEDDGADVNGQTGKVKPSPRMGGKRQKGTS